MADRRQQSSKRGRVTREEIARRAGVSTATVSYVLNDGPRPVSRSAHAAVLRAAEELGYTHEGRPHAATRQRKRLLAVLIPNITNPVLADLAERLETLAYEAGFLLAVATSNGEPAQTQARLDRLYENRIDGLLVLAARVGQEPFRRFLADQIPLVLLQYRLPEFAGDIVQVDNVDIGRQATDHLLAHGHSVIGCVAGPGAAGRIQGYRESLVLGGRVVRDDLIYSGDATVIDGQAGAEMLLARPDRPTAIFATNGLMAAGVLRAARDRGLRVPEDLAVVSADDSYFAIVTTPTLTTVGLPADDLARLGMGMLLDRIRGLVQGAPRHLTLKASLAVRESCGCAAHPLRDETGEAALARSGT